MEWRRERKDASSTGRIRHGRDNYLVDIEPCVGLVRRLAAVVGPPSPRSVGNHLGHLETSPLHHYCGRGESPDGHERGPQGWGVSVVYRLASRDARRDAAEQERPSSCHHGQRGAILKASLRLRHCAYFRPSSHDITHQRLQTQTASCLPSPLAMSRRWIPERHRAS